MNSSPRTCIPALAEAAAGVLEKSAYDNVKTYVGDGYFGVSEAAPFDGIMVTAAASHVPPPLIEQLKPGAKMIIPVGSSFAFQYLMMVEKGRRWARDHEADAAGIRAKRSSSISTTSSPMASLPPAAG